MKIISCRKYMRAPIVALMVSAVPLALTGCGDDGDSSPALPDTYVTGLAATGAPLANVTVTLKDASGKTASATTAADGSFRVVSTGLEPPYLLRVPAAQGNLYSVSADGDATTTINVTTLTDLATRAWFTVNGSSSLDAVFQNPSGTAFPAPSQVEYVEELIDDVFELWLRDAGVDPAASNLISTPFKADGTGVDKVLEQTSVSDWVITITGMVPTAGSTKTSVAPRAAMEAERTQVTTLSFDTSEKTVTAESVVTAGEVTSTTLVTTVVPTNTTMESAFQEIDTLFKDVAQIANQKGQALTVADILPFLDPEHLGQGLNQQEGAALFVEQVKMSSSTIGGYLISLDELDTVNGIAHGFYTFTETAGGQTATNRQESRFRLVNGKWLMSGDGRPGYMYVKAQTMTDSSGWGMHMEANAGTREGAYVAATVSGGQWTDAAMEQDDSTTVDEAGHRFRGFWLSTEDLSAPPAAGTPFTIKLQPTGGGPQESYVVKMNGATNALVWITSAPEGPATGIIGTTVTLAWTLPTVLVIDEVNLQGAVFAGPSGSEVSCDVWGAPLGTSATSGTITIPATCDGQPVTWLDLFVNVEGTSGEEIWAMRSYY